MSLQSAIFSLLLTAATTSAVTFFALPARAEEATPREIEIVVDRGYQPSTIAIPEGERVRLRFLRKDPSPCAREVVFPSLDLRRDLPVNEPVFLDLPALPPGEVVFHCGMKMLRGTIVVEARR